MSIPYCNPCSMFVCVFVCVCLSTPLNASVRRETPHINTHHLSLSALEYGPFRDLSLGSRYR